MREIEHSAPCRFDRKIPTFRRFQHFLALLQDSPERLGLQYTSSFSAEFDLEEFHTMKCTALLRGSLISAIILVSFSGTSPYAFGQTTTATIAGTVTDASGAVMADTDIQLRDLELAPPDR